MRSKNSISWIPRLLKIAALGGLLLAGSAAVLSPAALATPPAASTQVSAAGDAADREPRYRTRLDVGTRQHTPAATDSCLPRLDC